MNKAEREKLLALFQYHADEICDDWGVPRIPVAINNRFKRAVAMFRSGGVIDPEYSGKDECVSYEIETGLLKIEMNMNKIEKYKYTFEEMLAVVRHELAHYFLWYGFGTHGWNPKYRCHTKIFHEMNEALDGQPV